MIEVHKIEFDSAEYKEAIAIRKVVFVDEQKVPWEDELDEFEERSHHFLANENDQAVGTARWRDCGEYIKLERFAVLKAFRGKQIGSGLVDAVLKDIEESFPKGKKLLLHSQIAAVPLYLKFGFQEEGELFEECGIQHRSMSRLL